MKTCRLVLLCALLITCLCGCSLFSYIFLSIWSSPFHADITVADLSADLYWDETAAGTLEYAWGLKIDYDANATTGEPPDGFDLRVWITHTSNGTGEDVGGVPLDSDILNEHGTHVFRCDFQSWQAGVFETETDNRVRWNVVGNTISISFDYQGFAYQDQGIAPTAGFRTRFFTSYYPPPTGPETNDETAIVIESELATDAAGDAGSFPFIDIVSAQISHIPPRQ
jgi:hypothetical protein